MKWCLIISFANTCHWPYPITHYFSNVFSKMTDTSTAIAVLVYPYSLCQTAVEMFWGCECAATPQAALGESSPSRHVPWLIQRHAAKQTRPHSESYSLLSCFSFTHPRVVLMNERFWKNIQKIPKYIHKHIWSPAIKLSTALKDFCTTGYIGVVELCVQ